MWAKQLETRPGWVDTWDVDDATYVLTEYREYKDNSHVAHASTATHAWVIPVRLLACASLRRVTAIDYRGEDGRFPVCTSCVTIPNPVLLSSSEMGVNPGMRSWKCTYLIELDVRNPLVYIFHKSLRAETLQSTTGFRIWQLSSNPGLKVGSSNTSSGWTVRFLWGMIGFSERGSQDLSNGTNFVSQLANFLPVFTLTIYG